MERTATKKLLSKQVKSSIMLNLEKEISNSKCVILASYEGLTVSDITQLKKAMVKLNSKFNVYRNRLLMMSLEKISLKELSKFIVGPTSLIVCPDEDKIVDVVKYVCEFAKEKTKLKLTGGYMFNTIVDAEKLKEISQIPNKETLVFKLLSLLVSPINNLYSVLKGPNTALLSILEQLKNQKK